MSDSVDDVKDAIKVKKPDTIKCEADKLQVYLAKKDGARLTEAGAESVVLDEHGHPRGFEKMMPSLWLKNAKYFGESFQPGEGQVHVLVVVPEGAVVSANEGSPDTMIKEIHAVTVGKKRKRYVLSRVGSTQGRQLLNDLDVQVDLCAQFHLLLERGLRLIHTSGRALSLNAAKRSCSPRSSSENDIASQDILSVSIPGRDIELVGRTDLLILSDLIDGHPSEVEFLPGREVKRGSVYQALSQLIALDLLVKDPVMALLTDLTDNWQFFWVSEGTILKAIIKKPGEAFQVIRTLLAQSLPAGTEIKLPCFQDPVKRLKLRNVLPSIAEASDSGGIRESIERYYDIASMLGPDIEMERSVARQATQSIPAFSYVS
ncbi:hypothetical protein F444_14799 [Phytophthora nicotianae P1976]|uniref:Crinkler effector protein N-terminal domain-containing protein n=1 Tax=Phytophthora nicotianae P1976 TaxID=1317066 RepID=A0A080ZNZ1_PHYNI|nr:hypothetical protein F444_14799 [Phytophthora nicotianae P1976]